MSATIATMPTDGGYPTGLWLRAELTCDGTCANRIEQVKRRADPGRIAARLRDRAHHAGWATTPTGADYCPTHRCPAPPSEELPPVTTPPPVDDPIGPPLPVHTVTTTPAGVHADAVIPYGHPAYPGLLATATAGLSLETLTGAPGTGEQDCPAPAHCATHGTDWAR